MAERFGGYILEQSVLLRAVTEFIVEAGFTCRIFQQRPVVQTSGQMMLKCISMQNFITIYNVVQEV